MARLLALITVLLMLTVPALADAYDEAAAFAAKVLPTYTFF